MFLWPMGWSFQPSSIVSKCYKLSTKPWPLFYQQYLQRNNIGIGVVHSDSQRVLPCGQKITTRSTKHSNWYDTNMHLEEATGHTPILKTFFS